MSLSLGNALDFYANWESPTVIMSDGPYGIEGYEGDLNSEDKLAEWYSPHIEQWTKYSKPITTLWFWNTEVGWAEVHPVLKKHGWVYRSCNIWDKGIGHIAGNCNTKTMRKFPVVTEVCAHYVRKPEFFLKDNQGLTAQEWLRHEWKRTGLPFSSANIACNVKNAATRKYLTSDNLWYFPPKEVFERLVSYANEHGKLEGKPYFSIDGKNVLLASQWEQLRGKFYCPCGVTNVWQTPGVRGSERIKNNGKFVHPNQKPLSLMNTLIESSSDRNDVVWEPFGGLCSASVSAIGLGRKPYAAEINSETYKEAVQRLQSLEDVVFAN